MPVLEAKAPPNLHTGRKREVNGWRVQANESNELLSGLGFHRPEAPTSSFDEGLATIGQCVTLRVFEWRREKLHHS